MINMEPTLKRSTAICRLGPALFKSPESVGIWRTLNGNLGKGQEVFAYGSE